MQRANEASSEMQMTVSVGRFNEPTREVSLNVGDTVSKILSDSGIVISPTEEVWCNGEKIEMSDLPEAGDYISIIANKSGGLMDDPDIDTAAPEQVNPELNAEPEAHDR